jgi:hypothetical protein
LAIIQENRSEERSPGQFLETESPDALDYPESHREQRTRRIPMPVFFWSGLLAFGILILLARSPINAPPFVQLTQYVCDPVPPLASRGYGNRSQSYNPQFTCRAADIVVYQRGHPFDGSNPDAVSSCKRSGGILRIWRHANPSPYGPYVFQSSCNDQFLMLYKDRATAYEASQSFVIVVGWLLIGVGGIGLARKILVSRRRLANTT